MKEWLRAVLVNAPAVLLLAIVFSSVYLTAIGKDIPSLLSFIAAGLVGVLAVGRR